jgi:DNA-binding GntR family transcriptional regulator
MSITPSGRALQGQKALDFIRSALLAGRWRPGEALHIDSLASAVEVSRQTILEALRILAGQGLVTITPQVGCHVARHTPQQISDFFSLFASVEGLLAGLAAERSGGSDLEPLRWLSSRIGRLRTKSATEEQRANDHRELNRLFHAEMHRLARAPEIVSLAESFWDRSEFHIVTSVQTRLFSARLEDAHDEHEEIVNFISQGRKLEAERAMRQHVEAFRDSICHALLEG